MSFQWVSLKFSIMRSCHDIKKSDKGNWKTQFPFGKQLIYNNVYWINRHAVYSRGIAAQWMWKRLRSAVFTSIETLLQWVYSHTCHGTCVSGARILAANGPKFLHLNKAIIPWKPWLSRYTALFSTRYNNVCCKKVRPTLRSGAQERKDVCGETSAVYL